MAAAFSAVVAAAFVGIYMRPSVAYAQQSVSERRAALEKQLAQLEAEIKQQQQILEGKKNQRVSLERDIAILNAQITQAKLSIKARALIIERLNEDIGIKQKKIGVLSRKIDDEKSAMSELIRKLDDADSYTLPEILLSNKKFSDFFVDADSYHLVKASLRETYLAYDDAKDATEEEKQDLEDKRHEQTDLLGIQQLQKKRIEEQEQEKRKILALAKGEESAYQRLLKDKEKNANAIRTELFSLRGSAAISFEKAYQLVKEVGAKTGVRPALILGIIAEESNLGENVGTGNWRVDMKAPRDTVPFEDICRRLGLDPDKMPVSKKPWYGYGGAMGPAQFIPSTWVLYESKIAALSGSAVPNPWNPRDAFYASGILMKENGAAAGTRAAERLAALRYLAGWNNATKPAYAFYGDDVMALADKYQKQINILEGK
jgi:peptidoglycan hydrolase CwlO-like protein